MLHNSVAEWHPCLPQPDQQSASMQRRINELQTSAQDSSPFASYLMGNLMEFQQQTNKQTKIDFLQGSSVLSGEIYWKTFPWT